MKYFENIPSIDYPYYGKLIGDEESKITLINTVDIMVRFRIRDEIVKTPLAYYTYQWKDGDRPDKVAALYYDSPDFAWLVMMSAAAFDWLYEFPMSNRQFQDYIESRYGSYTAALNTIHHYEDGDGDIIDQYTYDNITDPYKKAVSVLSYEEDLNESKREVKLLSKEFLPSVVREYNNMLKALKNSRDLLKTEQILVN